MGSQVPALLGSPVAEIVPFRQASARPRDPRHSAAGFCHPHSGKPCRARRAAEGVQPTSLATTLWDAPTVVNR